jgi:hypothetical protein
MAIEEINGQDKKPKGVFNWFESVFNWFRDLSLFAKVVGVIAIILTIYTYYLARDFNKSDTWYWSFLGSICLLFILAYVSLQIKKSHTIFSGGLFIAFTIFSGGLLILFTISFIYLLYSNLYIKIDSDYLYNNQSKRFIEIKNGEHKLSVPELIKGNIDFFKKNEAIKTNFIFTIIIYDPKRGIKYTYIVSVKFKPSIILFDTGRKTFDDSSNMYLIKSEIKEILSNIRYLFYFDSSIKEKIKKVFLPYFPKLTKDYELDTVIEDVDVTGKAFIYFNWKRSDGDY